MSMRKEMNNVKDWTKEKSVVPCVLVKNDEYWLPYVLESVAGIFPKMVIYDVGSEDGTKDILRWYIDKEYENTEFIVRFLPDCPPTVQGTFRNAMIAETQADWYLILDGDEIYSQDDALMLNTLPLRMMSQSYRLNRNKIYGVFNRVEMSEDLKKRYERERSHHRVYHRTAIWRGKHPGENPVIVQDEKTEVYMSSAIKVWHMHNCSRSSLDNEVPKRLERRSQATYHPGELVDFNLLDELPILRKPINNFPVAPELLRLQEGYNGDTK